MSGREDDAEEQGQLFPWNPILKCYTKRIYNIRNNHNIIFPVNLVEITIWVGLFFPLLLMY